MPTLLPTTVFSGPLGPMLDALKHAKRITPSPNKTAIPILTCVMLRQNSNGAPVMAVTDLDCEFEFHMTDAVLTRDVVLPIAAMLAGLDGEDRAASVTIALRQEKGDDPVADVTVGDFTFTVTTYPTEDFPVFPTVAGMTPGACVPISADVLLSALSAVRVAVSTEETRYYLNGIYIHAAPETEHGPRHMRMVSTDGHKLMSATFAGKEWAGPGLILPRSTVEYLMPIIKGSGAQPLTISSYGEVRVIITGPGWTLRTKIVDGTFPDYTRVIPRDNPRTLQVETAAIIAACKKLKKLQDARYAAVAVDPDDQSLHIRGSGSVKAARVAVPFEPNARTGDTITSFGVNATYLSDIAGHMGDRMDFASTSPGDPVRFTPVVQPAGYDLLAVIMPMRI